MLHVPQQAERARAVREEAEEALLKEREDRFCMFPIEYPSVWRFYKRAVACFWTCEEVDLAQDLVDWHALTANERHFIKHVLAFFASSDGIVIENLAVRFMNEIQVRLRPPLTHSHIHTHYILPLTFFPLFWKTHPPLF